MAILFGLYSSYEPNLVLYITFAIFTEVKMYCGILDDDSEEIVSEEHTAFIFHASTGVQGVITQTTTLQICCFLCPKRKSTNFHFSTSFSNRFVLGRSLA
jgi:hypothetical protein